MSNENALTIVPRTIGEVQTLAEMLSKSTLLPEALKGNVANVAMQILTGQELGLSPMASIRSIHIITGKPVLSADGMVAVVLGSGKAKYFRRIAESDTSVTYETHRVGNDEPQRCTWTLEDAKRAALDKKDNWRAFPRAMLASRAKSELARDVFSDVLAGCYSDDESNDSDGFRQPGPIVQRDIKPSNTDAVDAEIVSETSGEVKLTADEAIATIAAARTADDVKALAPSLTALRDNKAVKVAYQARLKELAA